VSDWVVHVKSDSAQITHGVPSLQITTIWNENTAKYTTNNSNMDRSCTGLLRNFDILNGEI
ncbi:hypothetical protein HK096_003952, partial [Nowakowskiella sp. JEL0078]